MERLHRRLLIGLLGISLLAACASHNKEQRSIASPNPDSTHAGHAHVWSSSIEDNEHLDTPDPGTQSAPEQGSDEKDDGASGIRESETSGPDAESSGEPNAESTK